MNQMIGADVTELRQLAAQFTAAANQLRTTAGRVDGGIRISAWMGPVAIRFRLAWDNEHSRAVKDVAQALEDAGRRLNQEASDQEAASGSLTRTTSGPVIRAASRSGPGWNPFEVAAGGAGWLSLLVGSAIDLNLEDLKKAGAILDDYPGLKTASKALGVAGLLASAYDLGEGLYEGDFGKSLWGGGNLGLGLGSMAAGAAGLAGAPVTVAAGVTMAVGGMVMPIGEEEYDGSYQWMMEKQFGSDWDPDNPTTEQIEWQSQHMAGPGGVVNTLGAAMGYKTEKTMNGFKDAAGAIGDFATRNWPW